MSRKVAVRYVGPAKLWVDHLYGSGVGFGKGKVSLVPDWAAAKLLTHPEFEDARPKEERGTPILAVRKPTPEEIDKERNELDELAVHVRVETMTKEQLAAHTLRNFGVRLNPALVKGDMLSQVTHLMRMRDVR